MDGNKRLKFVIYITLGIILFLLSLRCFSGELFFENRTSSAPQGIYLRSFGRLSYDDYVIVALDRDVAALKEGYLLLKRVKGFPGDVYIVNKRGVTIRGQFFPAKHLRGIPHLEEGAYIVPKGKCLLLNDSDESFDSRYIGPMGRDRIRAKVKMLLPYGPLARLFAKK